MNTYRQTILQSAISATAERGQVYGTPKDNFERIARRWNAHLRNLGIGHVRVNVEESETGPLTAIDVAVMMADVKLARLEETPSHADSWIDLAGYAACGAEIACSE